MRRASRRGRGRAVVDPQVPGLGVGEVPLDRRRPAARVRCRPRGAARRTASRWPRGRAAAGRSSRPGSRREHRERRAGALARRACRTAGRGPGSESTGRPAARSLRLHRPRALAEDLLEREAEARRRSARPSPAARTPRGCTAGPRAAARRRRPRTRGPRARRSAIILTPKAMWRCSSRDDVAHPRAEARAAGRGSSATPR